jgi:hypothetical protein
VGSKFIDKLKQVSQAMPQPVGFRTTQSVSPKPKILLVASLAQADMKDMADCVAGADAGLVHISELGSGAKAIQKIYQAVPDIPWGGWLRDSGRGEIKQIVKVGCDFVVFPAANTPLAIFQGDEGGKILEVEPSISEGLLRAVDELPVDAVLIASEQAEGYFLTWHHLMLFQRFADLLTKPLLVSVPLSVTASELQALWEAGVDGVVVEVESGQPAERLKELRQVIDKMVFPTPRRQGKARALLPYVGRETSIVTEEGGEEEE